MCAYCRNTFAITLSTLLLPHKGVGEGDRAVCLGYPQIIYASSSLAVSLAVLSPVDLSSLSGYERSNF